VNQEAKQEAPPPPKSQVHGHRRSRRGGSKNAPRGFQGAIERPRTREFGAARWREKVTDAPVRWRLAGCAGLVRECNRAGRDRRFAGVRYSRAEYNEAEQLRRNNATEELGIVYIASTIRELCRHPTCKCDLLTSPCLASIFV
jgi:hypothetical protein